MHYLLITYDLIKRGQNYPKIYDGIKTLGNSCHLLGSVWVVKTIHTAVNANKILENFIDNNDELVVADLGDNLESKNLSKEKLDCLNNL